jgi:hypothetical protein
MPLEDECQVNDQLLELNADRREGTLSIQPQRLLSFKGRNEEKTLEKSGNRTNREIMHLEMGNPW